MTRHDTHGIYCQDCHVMHAWTELDKTIISDGEGGLIWIWSCPVWAGVELRREPFVFPRDMPGFTSSQPEARTPSADSGGTYPHLGS